MGRRWAWLLWGGLACWAVGFWWHWSRTSLWILDLLVNPLMAMLYLGGLGAMALALVKYRFWVAIATVLPALLVATLLVNAGWKLAPRNWFALHRPFFDRALGTDPGSDYYGNSLPTPLRFLTVDGKVSNRSGSRFFPQWVGIPDDAGGYFYDPQGSPEGADMYGFICAGATDLGDGWWMCGLRENGL